MNGIHRRMTRLFVTCDCFDVVIVSMPNFKTADINL